MILIIDENKNVVENFGTNSMYPDGNIPNLPELPQGRRYIKINDNSPLTKKIFKSHTFSTVFDGDTLVDINVTKTIDEYRKDQPKEENKLTIEERITALEIQMELIKSTPEKDKE